MSETNLFLLSSILLARNSCDAGKVLDDSLGVHSLSCTRFSTESENNRELNTSRIQNINSALQTRFKYNFWNYLRDKN